MCKIDIRNEAGKVRCRVDLPEEYHEAWLVLVPSNGGKPLLFQFARTKEIMVRELTVERGRYYYYLAKDRNGEQKLTEEKVFFCGEKSKLTVKSTKEGNCRAVEIKSQEPLIAGACRLENGPFMIPLPKTDGSNRICFMMKGNRSWQISLSEEAAKYMEVTKEFI